MSGKNQYAQHPTFTYSAWKEVNQKRNQVIYGRFLNGEAIESLARAFELSRSRIHVIVKDAHHKAAQEESYKSLRRKMRGKP